MNKIELWAELYSRESVYKYDEIKWCLEVLYKYHKNYDKAKDSMKHILIICANNNEVSLYSLFSLFLEQGIIKKKNVSVELYNRFNAQQNERGKE